MGKKSQEKRERKREKERERKKSVVEDPKPSQDLGLIWLQRFWAFIRKDYKWIIGLLIAVLLALLAPAIQDWWQADDKRAHIYVEMEIKQCPAKRWDTHVIFHNMGVNSTKDINGYIYFVPRSPSSSYIFPHKVHKSEEIPGGVNYIWRNLCTYVDDPTYVAILGTYLDVKTDKEYPIEQYVKITKFFGDFGVYEPEPEERELLKKTLGERGFTGRWNK